MSGGKLFAIGCGGFLAVVFFIAAAIGMWIMGTYNSLQRADEDVNNAWGQVENVYQRRYDLIPNLMATVKGYAEHEKSTFTAVTEARAKVGSMNIDVSEMTTNPEMQAQFFAAQKELGSAISRLLVSVEAYPELKANQNFLSFQDELAGTENRVAVERKRFQDAVNYLNKKIRVFPANILASQFGIEKRAYYESDEGAESAPVVSFE